ncbi:MAG TPA: amidase [Xanthobacteraceae bacterium]|nr:amidase [Xanthobacteraceae bacterium]
MSQRPRHTLGGTPSPQTERGSRTQPAARASQVQDTDAYGCFVPGPRCVREPTGHGALSGLSFAVKDLIDVAGWPTGGGNPDWLASHPPAETSAPAIEALLAAGARLAGKTVTDELAFSLEGVNAHYGTPLNPACPDRLPGGSSSGSAVAVAAGLVDFALGTDTGGSVRVPSSFTGIYGFRPSHGRVSTAGVVPFAPSYDTLGWCAREPHVLRAVGEALVGCGSPEPIRRLLLVRDAFALATPEAAPPLLAHARRWGAVADITVFDGAEAEWLECYRVLQGAEIWQQLGPWIIVQRPTFGPSIASRFADAATIDAGAITRYRKVREAIARRITAIVPAGTGLVIPTTLGPAPPISVSPHQIGAFYQRALPLNAIAGHPGLPQVTIPVAHIGGCPLGLSIIGAPGSDLALLTFAMSAKLVERSETA